MAGSLEDTFRETQQRIRSPSNGFIRDMEYHEQNMVNSREERFGCSQASQRKTAYWINSVKQCEGGNYMEV